MEHKIRRLPGWLASLVKVVIAGLLILWLVRRGLLDLSALGSAIERWPYLLAIGTLFYVQLAIISWRWNRLIAAQQIDLSLRDTFSLTMIGCLFNLVAPSAVGGDLMKSYYVHQRGMGRTVEAMATILLDRILGLLALLSTAAAAAIPVLAMGQNRAAGMLCALAVLGAAAGTGVLILALRLSRMAEGRTAPQGLAKLLHRVAGTLRPYRNQPRVLWAGVGAGMVSNAIGCLCFYLAAKAIGVGDFPVQLIFLFPLGLTATALPLSPAGIGVGQVAFAELFRMASQGALTFGATAFTVFQAMQLLVNVSGILFYFSYRQEVRADQVTTT